jgi:hypothetical protein
MGGKAMVSSRTNTIRTAFRVGTRVRVKSHIMDPDFPELPLGGWVGEIAEVQNGPARNYLVFWSRDTLRNIQPVVRERCEKDDMCFDRIWLLEADLEPET